MKATEKSVALPTFPQEAPLGWAAICGAVSAVGLRWDWLVLGHLLAAIVLLELVCRWIPWLLSQGELRLSGSPKSSIPSTTLPYTQPDSPAQHAADGFARARRSWRAFVARPSGLWARTLVLLILTGLLLCYGMGTPGMWLGLGGLAAAVLCGFWLRTSPVAASIWAPTFFTTLAWILGALTGGADWSLRLAAAPVFGLAASGVAALRCGKGWGKGLLWFGLTAPAALLIAYRLALPAAAALFVAAPAFALAPKWQISPKDYVSAVRPLVWLSMAIMALALGLR